MTTSAKQKRLKELTKVRVSQEKMIYRMQNEIAELEGKLSKKKSQINAQIQQLSFTNEKLRTLGEEISGEIAKKNKEYV